ncbi:2Fe-2S iron-sulfur cluster-binding protein [Streptomyces sp. PAL114]|uniref:2Fe-2S iron-sulfur cluster-binding protein n=1 Tax=Streptomyces sp. PAL114 TaxID=2970893 RepID=UPI0028FDB850|nr:2Fe-2S iron-sulfur cluster-binding protein [Streptomyces sp. PAL114]MDU0300231.1 2Fe-2S iron-sulfur cluster-binding protein [Streptomyces sp. PAL114]
MTDDQHGQGTPPGGSRWDPLPQGDYDDGATAFVNLPEGGIDALLDAMESPLAAPGHGYVPPQITVTPATTAGTDPAATGSWAAPGAPVDGAQWHDPQSGQPEQAADRFSYDHGPTGQWTYDETAAAPQHAPGQDPGQDPAPGQNATGQWSIPVAGGDLPDESGEFTASSLVEQWGSTPPATLPGGAPAPWADTQSIGRPWGPGVPGVPQDHDRHGTGHQPQGGEHGPVHEPQDPAARQHGRPDDGAVHDHHAGGHRGGPAREEGPEEGQPRAADPSGYDPSATDVSAHGGPRPGEVSRPLPAEEHPDHREQPWQPGDATADGHPAEHPDSAPRGGTEPASGAHETRTDTGDAQAAPEPAERPSAAPADAGTRPGPGDGASAGPDTAPADDGSGEPDAPAAAQGPDGTDGPDILVAPHEDHPLASYVLRVNGTDRPVTDAWIGESLLYVLRERLGLAGAKDGCSQGECGACNVQVDGRLVASCLVPAVTAAGSEVRTVEGLAQDGRPSDVQRALARCGAVQCGFCVPGIAMTVHDLLEGNPAPTELETRQALCGNLCRCSGYRGVVDAVKEVVAGREAQAEAQAEAAASDDGDDTPRIPHQAGPGAGGVNPSAFGVPGPHDQSYGQDGGQA